MNHARLQPSSAGRVVQCPGSLRMESYYPETEVSPKSAEGTLAHAVIEAMLLRSAIPNGATDEMLDGAELWTDLLTPYIGEDLHIEERVDCTWVHIENWGTPDAWHFDRKTMVLNIWDYKFGHRFVDAFENWQMINYAAGILDTVGITGLTDVELVVNIHIVQPRCYVDGGAVRTWSVKGVDLRPYFNRLKLAWDEAVSDDPETVVGDNCRDCKARHACQTLQKVALSAVEAAGGTTPFDLPNDAISRELSMLTLAQGLLAARLDGLESEVLNRIKGGISINGWMAKQSAGREKWANAIDEVIALGDMMGVDVRKPSAITPKQAIKAGLSAELVSAYTETPAGSIKLERADGALAVKLFGAK